MKSFENQGLSPEILRAIADLGFVEPTPIQEKVIPAILNDSRDIIGLAQTGTGKTAGFGLPILQQTDSDARAVQAIILCPTRELCLQITNDLTSYAKYMDRISIVAVYGGAHIGNQMRDVKRGAQIIVGTPGRTLDLIKRKVLKIDAIRWLVLDEADEMLNMGFRDELDAILAATPDEKQVLLFSATMPGGVRQIAENYMNNPIEILAGKKNMGADNVIHHVYHVKAIHRFQALKRIIDVNQDIYGIVFCRTRNETRELADKLTQEGYNADALHGDLSQAQRDQVMMRFRKRILQLLVATDVAARGIDVNDLTHIINYSLPDDPEIYIHRSGRTGRAGKTGISITLAHAHDHGHIRQLEKLTGKRFEHQEIPSGKEICEKKLHGMIDKIINTSVDEKKIESFLPSIFKKFEGLEKEEIIKRFVSTEFTKFLDYYHDADNINISANDSGNKQHDRQQDHINFNRFHINVGRKQEINPHRLMGIINEFMGSKRLSIGKIEIFSNFSFFETEKDYTDKVLKAFENATFQGERLMVELSKPTSNNGNENKRSFREKDRGKDQGFNKKKRGDWKKGGRSRKQYR